MIKRKSIWIITIAVIATPMLVYALVSGYRDRFEKLPLYGEQKINADGKPGTHAVDDFLLVNQDGQKTGMPPTGKNIIVANFFFTSCPSVCPKMMQHVKSLQSDFSTDSLVLFYSFSVDPVHDSVAVLKKYAGDNGVEGGKWNLLTGDKKEIYKMARKSFYLSAADGDGGENDFIHSEQLVLVDKNRHIRGYYAGTNAQSVAQLKSDIKKLEHE